MAKNVCEVLLEVLANAEVKYIFGIAGGAINTLMEAIRKQDKIKLIQVRHEEAGAFAASAIGKLTGGLGVCMGTSGPGAIHLLNGLYDAKHDHAPVLAISGQAETRHQGVEYLQDVRLDRLFSDVAVYSTEIKNPQQMPRVAEEACRAALNYKGVAHLILPSDIAQMEVPDAEMQSAFFESATTQLPSVDDMQKAAKMLAEAGKVMILAGDGARDGATVLLQLAEKLKSPIIKALRGKDIIPDTHPYCLGGLGLLGTTPAVNAINSCDLLLIVGTDFPYFDFYPQKTLAIQIDIDPKQIGKRIPVALGLAGDAQQVLSELVKLVSPKEDSTFLENAQKEMKEWWKDLAKAEDSKDEPIHPQAVADAIGKLASEDAIFCCDTGNVTVWAARSLKIDHQQSFTISGGMASMGYGLPAAIGAKLTFPHRQVFAVCGDGGFTMLMCDFLTAVQYELPIVVVIFNNGKLGMIQMEQEAMGYPEYGIQLKNPDFALFAQACGGLGETVKKAEQLEESLQRAIQSNKPYILDVHVNPEELTMPPKIDMHLAFDFAKAKVREFFGQGDQK